MAHDSYPGGRSPYQNPDAVLAEARRIAADIRRRAEREASAVRRDAAEWASATRREAERHRERVLAELQHAIQVAGEPQSADAPTPRRLDRTARRQGSPGAGPGDPEARDLDTGDPDLGDPHTGDRDAGDLDTGDLDTGDLDIDDAPSAPVIDLRSAAEARGTPMPMSGRTYVVGHTPPPVETSIETKVHDVVRSTVRRTFNRRFS